MGLQTDDQILDALGVVSLGFYIKDDEITVTVAQINRALQRAYDIGYNDGYSTSTDDHSGEGWW